MKKLILSVIYVILYTTCTYAYNNLALRKPAWQAKYFSQSRWGADKAVDGNYTDRGSLGDQCTVSADKQQTAEWRVDLESVVSISYINIFYRTDNNPGSYAKRFAGFYVYVSNTSSKENGILCFHELQTVSGTPLEDQRINCSMYGRYVIYYNERLSGVVYPSYYSQYAFNELCEVEVYGCPVPGYYGVYCNKSCPVTCQGQQCDAVTGNCVKGCLPEYQGPHCSYLNLALGRPAWQKHNWPSKEAEWGAAKAVDGKYSDRGATGGQCTISDFNQRTAEWRVDLEKIVSISHIHIYYRTDNVASPGAYYNRFAGFYVYISNNTNKDNGRLCFHELQQVNGTPTENQKIQCPYDGRYVIYYNERRQDVTYPSYYSIYAHNELCELEVYGCPGSKYYGQYCDRLCPENCFEQVCNMFTGNCFECNPGYKGHHCSQECDGKMYGPACSQSCGYCLHNTQCNHINGSCSGGCSAGYEGSLCKKQCEGGLYGYNCDQTCGRCINNSLCHHINGTCLEGCSTGHKEPLCKNECDGGMYGEKCDRTCGHCFDDRQCHHINGTCLQGCSIGYKGLLCTTECDGGMFGINCNQGCGYCLNDKQCHHINGSCLRGCSKGYQGVLCNAGCQGGSYGHNCNESCGHCMNNATCDHINGTCPGRCSVGYEGLLCTNVCRPSYWGVNCKETCSKACFNQTCHHETGHCISYEQSQSCETCKVDYTITITSVTVSVLIVLMGSLLNFYIWRKMQQKGTVLDTQNEKVYYNEFSAVDSRDKQSGRDVVTSPYAELSELDHQNTYEELHQYEKADGKM